MGENLEIGELRKLRDGDLQALASRTASEVMEAAGKFSGSLRRLALIVVEMQRREPELLHTPFLVGIGLSRGSAASVGAFLSTARLFAAGEISAEEFQAVQFLDALELRKVASVGSMGSNRLATATRLRIKHGSGIGAGDLVTLVRDPDPFSAAETLCLQRVQNESEPAVSTSLDQGRKSAERPRGGILPTPFSSDSAEAPPSLAAVAEAFAGWVAAQGGVSALRAWTPSRAAAALDELAGVIVGVGALKTASGEK